jgi:ubiquinone/menaquinone biosynthesis C-methylase UbiE
MSFALQECFSEPLHDLGEAQSRLRGIFVPASERGVRAGGVTAQFLEDAGEYHRRYDSMEGFRAVIARMLADHAAPAGMRILDVGSGSGNSVIPLLELYPEAFVVATDASPELLLILRDVLEARPACRGRYGLVCMDANNDRFRRGAFDLAVGAAILHHIVDPRRVLDACAGALRPGGAALFIEPFEPGHGVLRIAYRRILGEARRRGEGGAGFAMLERMVVDHETRLRDKSDPVFDTLDDKWYFTRAFFEAAVAGDAQWEGCRVEPLGSSPTPLADHALGELRLALDADASALPPWAWEILREHEGFFSRDGLRDLTFEAAVLLRRSALADRPAAAARRNGWWWDPAQPGRGFFIEFEGDARIACCVYDAEGAPAWRAADGASLVLSGRAYRLGLSLKGAPLRLEPQHLELPRGGKTGWWTQDAEPSPDSIVVEDLGNRVMAALLARDGWSLLVGSQRGPRVYEGKWLRFTGGQALGGPYRAPGAPAVLGPGVLSWTGDESLIALGPDARRHVYRRLAPGAPAPQNLRSTEKCAS